MSDVEQIAHKIAYAGGLLTTHALGGWALSVSPKLRFAIARFDKQTMPDASVQVHSMTDPQVLRVVRYIDSTTRENA